MDNQIDKSKNCEFIRLKKKNKRLREKLRNCKKYAKEAAYFEAFDIARLQMPHIKSKHRHPTCATCQWLETIYYSTNPNLPGLSTCKKLIGLQMPQWSDKFYCALHEEIIDEHIKA